MTPQNDAKRPASNGQCSRRGERIPARASDDDPVLKQDGSRTGAASPFFEVPHEVLEDHDASRADRLVAVRHRLPESRGPCRAATPDELLELLGALHA